MTKQALQTVQKGVSQSRRELSQKIQLVGNAVEKIPDWKNVAAKLGKAFVHSVGHLVEGRTDWVNNFRTEWEKIFEENPEVKNFTKTQEGQDVFSETLRLLGLENVFVKLNCIKSVYMQTLKNYRSGEEQTLSGKSLVYLKVCSDLDIGELLALRSAYSIALSNQTAGYNENAHIWREKVAEALGIPGQENLLRVQTTLEEYGLINKRGNSDLSGMGFGSNFGLTDFGMAFCDFAFDDIKSSA